jgi:hypothetical protein
MANPQVYTWPIAAVNAVALVQSRTGAGALLLNGTLKNVNDTGLVIKLGAVSRVLTLTSVNDLHLINVTITGTLNGVVVSETRAGPTSNTVATTQVFSTITSITTSGTVTAMSVGTGTTGYTNWFTFDKHASVANLAIQVDATATVSYSLQVTLDNVQGNNSPLTFTPISAMTTASTDQLANYTAPFQYARIAMVSSDATGAFTATFLQQGLHS